MVQPLSTATIRVVSAGYSLTALSQVRVQGLSAGHEEEGHEGLAS